MKGDPFYYGANGHVVAAKLYIAIVTPGETEEMGSAGWSIDSAVCVCV